MTKVRINNLPKGFTIENGKVKKVMKEGGSTGDQVGYSLKTFVPTSNGGQDRGADNANVRYSLTKVPREVANIEAEGGETVLTDLSGMGAFGLYDINGPRHSSGGVPMYLPEDSFIFSDTNDMKFDRNELKEFDIKSRKKQTPAKISKKFGLNRYYAEIEDPFADDIQVGSAEIMLDKNKRNLSKLAFMQEAKKNFKEGVPRTAYPYLMSKGINPEQFEERTQRSNLFRDGGSVDLPMAQLGPGTDQPAYRDTTPQFYPGFNWWDVIKANNTPSSFTGDIPFVSPYTPAYSQANKSEYEIPGSTSSTKPKTSSAVARPTTGTTSRPRPNIAYDPNSLKQWQDLGINFNTQGINETAYADVQRSEGSGRYGSATQNEAGWVERWKSLYEGADALAQSLPNYKVGQRNPEVEKFQNWFNNNHVPSVVQNINEQLKAAGKPELTSNQITNLTSDLVNQFGFGKGTGKGVDGLYGTYTSSRFPMSFTVNPTTGKVTPVEEQETNTDAKINPGTFKEYTSNTKPEFWQQDAVKMGALAARKRDLRLPWQKPVENTEVGYILEDPTRAIGAINEQMGINNEALKSFSGPQALNARMAQSTAKAAEAVANTVAGVNQRNVQTVNRGLGAQAYYDMMGERENARRLADTYDKTQLALENYQNERNFDREQFADAYASALTNRANTYNLNMLSDYYDIQPGTGGLIKQTGYKEINPNQNSTKTAEDSFFDFAKRANQLGITDPTEAYQSIYGKTGTKSKKQQELEMLQKGKKGKELRRYATPFYSGKIGY